MTAPGGTRIPGQASSSKPGRPVAVAVTGGIGAGKSELLRAFARHGAAVRSSDEIVHDLLREDPEVKAAVTRRWGDRVLGAEGRIERAKIAEVVFADPDELRWLEELLHPRVVEIYMRWRDELAALDEPPALCIVEIPLLYETGSDARFDAVVVVTAPRELRAARRPVPDEREQRLLPEEEKVERADFVYVNDGSLEELDAFVSDVIAKLRL